MNFHPLTVMADLTILRPISRRLHYSNRTAFIGNNWQIRCRQLCLNIYLDASRSTGSNGSPGETESSPALGGECKKKASLQLRVTCVAAVPVTSSTSSVGKIKVVFLKIYTLIFLIKMYKNEHWSTDQGKIKQIRI